MIARVCTFTIDGVAAKRVWVEADIRLGLPAFTIVGLADKAVREARERVRSALVNSGYEFPQKRITVNLAPASLRKIGPGFDLSLAIALLVASDQLGAHNLDTCAIVGELSLTGDVRAVSGVLACAEGARRHELERMVVPRSRAHEAALVPDLEIVAVSSLEQLVDVLAGRAEPPELPEREDEVDDGYVPDLADVRGHNAIIPALEVAAAGGHNLLLHGPPGTGKTMLARRMPSILPPMSGEEALDVTRIHSIAGIHGGALITERPFRAPHHTVSAAGLVGGGSPPTPGEATLAHHGVLFLDELPEFARPSLEALRQPLEDGHVVIVRAQRSMAFPTQCTLVAAANPCPCGRDEATCRCTAADLARHQRRLSGPLLDRIDLLVAVRRPPARALRDEGGPPSRSIRERVVAARERQQRRLAPHGVTCNARMTARQLRDLANASDDALRLLYELHDRHALSARGHARVLRVARTMADLDGSDRIETDHIHAATGLRLDTTTTALAA